MKRLATMSVFLFATGALTSACMTEGEDPELETAASALPITAEQLETTVVPFHGGTITLDARQSARLLKLPQSSGWARHSGCSMRMGEVGPALAKPIQAPSFMPRS